MTFYVVKHGSSAQNIRERSAAQIRERYDVILKLAASSRMEIWDVDPRTGDIMRRFVVDPNGDIMAFNAWLRG